MSDASAHSSHQQLPSEEDYIPYMILFLTYVLNVKNQYEQEFSPFDPKPILDVLRGERLALGKKLGLPNGGKDFMKSLEDNAMYLPSLRLAAIAFKNAKEGYSHDHVGCPRSMEVLNLLAEKLTPGKPVFAKTV